MSSQACSPLLPVNADHAVGIGLVALVVLVSGPGAGVVLGLRWGVGRLLPGAVALRQGGRGILRRRHSIVGRLEGGRGRILGQLVRRFLGAFGGAGAGCLEPGGLVVLVVVFLPERLGALGERLDGESVSGHGRRMARRDTLLLLWNRTRR